MDLSEEMWQKLHKQFRLILSLLIVSWDLHKVFHKCENETARSGVCITPNPEVNKIRKKNLKKKILFWTRLHEDEYEFFLSLSVLVGRTGVC